jgi:glycosyltransferase involved in cell wall biosynthesis
MTNGLELGNTVHFTGQISHQDLLAEFSACDLFCLPSLQEGFGLVFLQAMAAGIPIIALRASSTPELIEHGVNGLLAAPGDDADLAHAIKTCLADSHLRTIMSNNNIQKAATHSLDKVVTRLTTELARAM